MNKVHINEKEILSIIEKVINENRKVLKLGNNEPQMAPTASMPPMPQDTDAQMPPMDGADLGNGSMPPADSMGDNQFDTNFDAGVEADEETDPKHYIQQLTGKLSQSLNSFNNEQGGDPGLNKYVASMIVAAACKSLDDKAKKEIIEKINSASSEEDISTDDMGEEGMEDGDMGDTQNVPDEQMPVNETVYTKKQIFEMFSQIDNDEKRPAEQEKTNKDMPKAWRSKF